TRAAVTLGPGAAHVPHRPTRRWTNLRWSARKNRRMAAGVRRSADSRGREEWASPGLFQTAGRLLPGAEPVAPASHCRFGLSAIPFSFRDLDRAHSETGPVW